jgi:hypothetical protein
MKVRDLLKFITEADLDKEILFSSDEELNCLRSKGEIATLSDKPNTLVIYGFDGSEVDDDMED